LADRCDFDVRDKVEIRQARQYRLFNSLFDAQLKHIVA
jgi:hypothetical protein